MPKGELEKKRDWNHFRKEHATIEWRVYGPTSTPGKDLGSLGGGTKSNIKKGAAVGVRRFAGQTQA